MYKFTIGKLTIYSIFKALKGPITVPGMGGGGGGE